MEDKCKFCKSKSLEFIINKTEGAHVISAIQFCRKCGKVALYKYEKGD